MQISSVLMQNLFKTPDANEVGIIWRIVCKENPDCNGYYNVNDLDDVPKLGYYKSPFRRNNVGWFVDEMTKLENQMSFYFKNTDKEIVLSADVEIRFRMNNTCWLL